MIRYWGTSAAVGKNASMPKEYGLLYNSLVNQQVKFPGANKYLNSSPTAPGGSIDYQSPAQQSAGQRPVPTPIRTSDVKPVDSA
jgi:hypothetical protein